MLLTQLSYAAQVGRTTWACRWPTPAAHAAVKCRAVNHAPAAPPGAGLAHGALAPRADGSTMRAATRNQAGNAGDGGDQK